MSGFLTIGYFLFSVLFGLVGFVLWARIALRYFQISAVHPVSHMVCQWSDPLVLPIQSLLPFPKTRASRYDWAAITVLLIVLFLKFTLVGFLLLGQMLPLWLIVVYVVANFITEPCNLLCYAIIIRAIMSWVNPVGHQQHAVDIITRITEPSLKLGRRYIPDTSGFDFAPLVVVVLLKVFTILIDSYLPLHLL